MSADCGILSAAPAEWQGRPALSLPDRAQEAATMTRVAAIDCGTNTIRLLIAEAHRDEGDLAALAHHQACDGEVLQAW